MGSRLINSGYTRDPVRINIDAAIDCANNTPMPETITRLVGFIVGQFSLPWTHDQGVMLVSAGKLDQAGAALPKRIMSADTPQARKRRTPRS